MRYGSVCSGIEAATAAWHPLGWEPAFFSEIEAFPSAVLKHHYPDVPLHGDFTTIGQHQYGRIDLLVGGTPCQSFSVAGLRGGLDDDRGNLALEFCRLAQREQPRWIVWENVPGVLSSGGGRDFGSILGALEDLGYGLAYRVLDAQHFGVPQRRRRVFVVGYLGDWRPAAAVLFERHSLSGHPAPRREARQDAAGGTSGGTYECGGIGSYSTSNVSSPILRTGADLGPGCEALVAVGRERPAVESGHVVADTLTSNGDAHSGYRDEKGLIAQKVTYPIDTQNMTEGHNSGGKGFGAEIDPSFTLTKGHSHAVAVAYDMRGREGGAQFEGPHDTANIRAASGGSSRSFVASYAVRRLTPVECERLQGFPDNFTDIPWRKKPAGECPDGPRYKALGNSMAVPVMRWIGERIQLIDDLLTLI